MKNNKYSIHEHLHTYSCWAASRGASVVNNRFSVQKGNDILTRAGLDKITSLNKLPSPRDFDKFHAQLRLKVIKAAKRYDLNFTHGVAAKLINLYLKAKFTSAENINNPKFKMIHPPIDSLLLKELYKVTDGELKKLFKNTQKIKWSKLSSRDYQKAINGIKQFLPKTVGLWEIEKYWVGYQ